MWSVKIKFLNIITRGLEACVMWLLRRTTGYHEYLTMHFYKKLTLLKHRKIEYPGHILNNGEIAIRLID